MGTLSSKGGLLLAAAVGLGAWGCGSSPEPSLGITAPSAAQGEGAAKGSLQAQAVKGPHVNLRGTVLDASGFPPTFTMLAYDRSGMPSTWTITTNTRTKYKKKYGDRIFTGLTAGEVVEVKGDETGPFTAYGGKVYTKCVLGPLPSPDPGMLGSSSPPSAKGPTCPKDDEDEEEPE